MAKQPTLTDLRGQIDQIDSQLLELFNQRAALSLQVAEAKRLENNMSFYCPEREQAVLQRLITKNKGPLNAENIQYLFRQIMSLSLRLQAPLKVACLGPSGTYSKQAVLQQFGDFVQPVLRPSIETLFQGLANGDYERVMVPIINSTTGPITSVLAQMIALYQQGLKIKIEAESVVAVEHCLLAAKNMTKSQLDDSQVTVYAHAESFKQCQSWLVKHLPGAKLEAVASNALAAEKVACESGCYAIASRACVEHYPLQVVAHSIADCHDNTTHFVTMSINNAESQPLENPSIETNMKTAYLLFVGKNKPTNAEAFDCLVDFLKDCQLAFWQSKMGLLVRLQSSSARGSLVCTALAVRERALAVGLERVC